MKVTNERKRLLRKFYTSAGLLIIGVIIAFGHGSAMGEVFLYQNIPGSKMGFSGREADVFNEDYEEIDVAGEDEISFMDESPASKPEEININALKNIAELRKKFYIVDKKTLMTEDYLKTALLTIFMRALSGRGRDLKRNLRKRELSAFTARTDLIWLTGKLKL